MSAYQNIARLLDGDRPGHTLPQQLYVGQEAFDFDTQVLLKSVWLYACTVAHVKKPGDYFVFELADNSIIIVRGRDNEVRAFHNSCRHRGARICEAQAGSASRLMCPYHIWTYGLDGKLLAARNMPDGFDKADHGLIPVALENIGGLLVRLPQRHAAADRPGEGGHRRAGLDLRSRPLQGRGAGRIGRDGQLEAGDGE